MSDVLIREEPVADAPLRCNYPLLLEDLDPEEFPEAFDDGSTEWLPNW